ncbi:hypothetical protein [Pseudonocardia spirodelae]|uniref:Uncharacterized protein n=1 Tax=Pseudonocardia spirodelae TaxID=3133431 RepID=A0ABU8T768_9PSEU
MHDAGRPLPPPGPGTARTDPDALDGAAAALDRVADALLADAAGGGAWPAAPGFATGAAAVAWEDAAVRATRGHAAHADGAAGALRASAAAWRAADDAAAAALAGRPA